MVIDYECEGLGNTWVERLGGGGIEELCVGMEAGSEERMMKRVRSLARKGLRLRGGSHSQLYEDAVQEGCLAWLEAASTGRPESSCFLLARRTIKEFVRNAGDGMSPKARWRGDDGAVDGWTHGERPRVARASPGALGGIDSADLRVMGVAGGEKAKDCPDPVSQAIANEQEASALAAMDRLPRRQREAVLRHAIDGVPHAELASELGVTETVSRQLVSRGLAKLRAAVET